MWNRKEIFIKELDKLLNDGMEYDAASKLALERADDIFFDMVDQARAAAKDRRFDR